MSGEEIKKLMKYFLKRQRQWIVDQIRQSGDSDAWTLAFIAGEECVLHSLEKYVDNDFQWDTLLRR